MDEEHPPAQQPWWIPPFLGRVPADMDPSHISLLGTIALALLFESYDMSMLGSALKHIRESFGVSQGDAATLTALVRLGAIPAFILLPFADRIGRRRLFLICIVGVSIATGLTAFSQNIVQFLVFQMAARTFLIAGSATAIVIVTETLPAAHRGWGIGILGALGAVGFGLGAVFFAAIEWLPYGWRALYAVGVIPLLLLPYFRRRVRETERFVAHRAQLGDEAAAAGWWRPLVELVREHPRRALLMGTIGGLAAAGHAPGHQLLSDYLQTDLGWSPADYSTMLIVGGGIGIVGNTASGRLADRIGRRSIGLALLIAFPVFAAALYQGPGWLVPLVWIPLVFVSTGANTIVRALATELFPTSSRGTATGGLMTLETLGAAGGLMLVAVFTAPGASTATAISVVVFACLLAGVMMLALPETARRELEEIAADESRH